MMNGMWATMALGWIAVAVALVVVIVVGVYIGLAARRRADDPEGHRREGSARGLLDRRLAAGEVSVEEYYERDAVLRGSTGR